jgi:hypothetical protein
MHRDHRRIVVIVSVSQQGVSPHSKVCPAGFYDLLLFVVDSCFGAPQHIFKLNFHVFDLIITSEKCYRESGLTTSYARIQ